MNSALSIWAITTEERVRHDKQFDTLSPILGYVSGDQIRRFFLQSGLAASVLTEIWSLADVTKDGKMDRLEFSIAMKLIKLKLQGQNLPSALPPVMKQPPVPSPAVPTLGFGMGSTPNLSAMPSMPMMSSMPMMPAVTPMPTLIPTGLQLPLIPSLNASVIPNGTAGLLCNSPATPTEGLPQSNSFPSSPLGQANSKPHSMPDFGSSSSSSSSTNSLASNSPKAGCSDWAVPQASRLKYRQQFNSLDKQMTGYLSGLQVRNALSTCQLTQTQLATIWNLADMDKDGKLVAEEFILAMHLVDMAKTGRPLPLTLPIDLLPPTFRNGSSAEGADGNIPSVHLGISENFDAKPPQKPKNNVTFEDKRKENFDRGNAELEKRRQALLEQQRREEELRAQKAHEEQERREREARELEIRRQVERERRLERQRELERQKEEERLRELERKEAAKKELERQRRIEWEQRRRQELLNRRNQEQEEIVMLRAKKKSLELELEAVGDKHKQISDRLRDAQSKKKIQKAELDLVNQKRDCHILEINSLQKQFEDYQKKLSLLVPEHQILKEQLNNFSFNNLPSGTITSLKTGVNEKNITCRKLKEQLDALEKETSAKLLEMDEYNRTIRELRESQRKQQTALEQLCSIREEKLRELQRRREQDFQRKQEEGEAARRSRLEKERQWQEKLRQDEELRQRSLQEEREARLRQEEKREAHESLQDTGAGEEILMQNIPVVQVEMCTAAGDEKAALRPITAAHRKSATLTTYKAQYPFMARTSDELTFDTGDLIEVDEMTTGEPGWLYGSLMGQMGWFPETYVEKQRTPDGLSAEPTPEVQSSNSETPDEVTDGDKESSSLISVQVPSSASLEQDQAGHMVSSKVQAQAMCSWSAKADSHLNFSKDDVITVLEQQETWWLGQLNGMQGWFPKSYVTLLKTETQTDQILPSGEEDASEITQQEEYVALYPYESPELGDLTFSQGDTILVTEHEGEWWKGSIGDRTGVFPANYVKPKEMESLSNPSRPGASKKPEIGMVTTPYTAAGTEQLTLAPGQLVLILNKNPTGWWLGELQARRKKRQKGWFPASHVKVLGTSSGKSTPAPAPICQVIALYDYQASNEDEMSFSKDQVIAVLENHDPDWWKAELNGTTGLIPTNYVRMIASDSDTSEQWSADLTSPDSQRPKERKRQDCIEELITTEERYVEDLQLALEVFHKPMSQSGRLTEEELAMIFINWNELIVCNKKLLKALHNRKKTCEKMPMQMIGDILVSQLSDMQAYIHFCSCQLAGAALLQRRTDEEPEFKSFLKKIATDYRCKGMPLSSYLLKPMQRLTRYPLLIKNILENTPETHIDHGHLKEAQERAEELCTRVNEGVREKENVDRLEWIQSHVHCEGVIENLTFNSLTNCLGPRRLLHSGKLCKSKSNKELYAFLFNDFLLLTHNAKQFSSSVPEKLFNSKSNVQLKMYKTPVFLNEVLVRLPSDPSSEEPVFHISHIDRVYSLKTENINERTAWVQKIKGASEHFIETEKKKREKSYQARSMKASGIGRLLVTIQEATELKACKPNGKSNPYCEVTMGAQTYTSRTLSDTLNPKWNLNCQFFIRDLYQDVLSITILEKDHFSPDQLLGRAELPVATIRKDFENKGPTERRLLLHEVPTGEVSVRLDLQLFEQK